MGRERFAVITPDRNDRPALTDHLMKQLDRMTLKPDCFIHVDYEPNSLNFDLVDRIRYGMNKVRLEGIDLVFVLENDDFYPTDYFERFGNMKDDFFGQNNSWYYNLRNKTHNNFSHPGRSSLMTTGFRISTLDKFDTDKNWDLIGNTPFLDIKLWQYANTYNKKCRFVDTGAIGIKTGIGLCGGKGHRMIFESKDPELAWLKSRVDKDSFEFYKSLKF